MGTEVFIFAGFMDSGKTTALQGVLSKNADELTDRALIICTEAGETEYSLELLKEYDVDVVYCNEEHPVTAGMLEEIDKAYNPKRVYLEFNGMWDLRMFLGQQLPAGWDINYIFSLVDAQTYDMYLRNMRQIIMNPLAVSDVILFNRCPEDIKEGDIRRALKILNENAVVYFVGMDGKLLKGSDDFFVESKDGLISVEEDMFCSWFVDCIEHTDRYLNKKVHAKMMVTDGNGLGENQFYVGRMVAVCCEEDAQFIGFVAECNGTAPEKGTWIDVTAYIRSGLTVNNNQMILFEIDEYKIISVPEEIYLYF